MHVNFGTTKGRKVRGSGKLTTKLDKVKVSVRAQQSYFLTSSTVAHGGLFASSNFWFSLQ